MSALLKLLYLLAGLSLKETVDSVKAICKDRVERLEKNKAWLQEPKLAPTIAVGSQEHHQMMAKLQWQADVAPEITKINREILRWKSLTPIAWGLLTVILFTAICIIESREPSVE